MLFVAGVVVVVVVLLVAAATVDGVVVEVALAWFLLSLLDLELEDPMFEEKNQCIDS